MMRKVYFRTILLTAVAAMAALPGAAQGGWTSLHKSHAKAPVAEAQPMEARNDHVYLGYAAPDNYIWEYDGIGSQADTRGAAAILLTPDMLKPYAGGTITGMLAGWDTSQRTGQYSGFVRKGFHGDNVALNSTPATVSYSYQSSTPGWNTITFDSTYVIPDDPDTLIVGFYTDLPAGLIVIPTLYPHNTPNSCFLYLEGDTTATGEENWIDGSDMGILAVLLRITDRNGDFQALGNIESLYYDRIVYSGENATALAVVANHGSKAIKNFELTYDLDGQTHTERVNLSGDLNSGAVKRVSVPIWCQGSGVTRLTMSKINGKDNKDTTAINLHLLGVPTETAYSYDFHPLVEFFESENSYMSPTYYEECIQPTLEPFTDEVNYVSQHMDDQFMTGDDDALALSLWLADNDSMQVELPCMGINRSLYVAVTPGVILGGNTPLHSSLYPDFGQQVMRAVLEMPTFARIDGNAQLDGDQLTVNVNGNVADGVLADGEQLYYTVYLMEDSVTSSDQMFWGKDDEEEHKGQYTHPTIIREIMTDMKGDLLGGAGDFSKTLTTEIDPEWNRSHLRVVAFVNRGGDNDNFDRQIINSTAFAVTGDTDGISTVATSDALGGKLRVYDLSGRLVKHPARHGIYIVGGQKVVF